MQDQQTQENHEQIGVWRAFSSATWVHVLCLVIPLAGLLIGFKVQKLLTLAPKSKPSIWFAIFHWDLVFLLLFSLLFLSWLEFARGWKLKLGTCLLHVIAFFFLVIMIVEQRFFQVTGSFGDWYLLRYAAEQLATITDILANQLREAKWLVLGGVALVVGMNVLPLWLKRRFQGRVRGRLGTLLSPMWLAALCFVLLLMELVSPFKRSLTGDLRGLARNVPAFLLAEMSEDLTQHQKRKRGVTQKFTPKDLVFDTRTLRFARTPDTRNMNVVLIVLESFRRRSVTAYRPEVKTTPFLADLAKRSLLVANMDPVIPHTSKALVSIFCGIPPKVNMPIVESQPNGIPGNCIPRLFRNFGYKTAFFQSATLNFEGRERLAENMGFAEIYGHENLETKGFFKTNSFGFEDKIMLKPSLKWIEQRLDKKQPFFLGYLTLVSHYEYRVPPDFPKRRYTNRRDHQLNKYLNAIHYVDRFLKKLFAEFKKRGLYKNTLFVLTGDHGEAFSEHRRRQHDNAIWDEIMRTPAMVFSPKLFPKGGVIRGNRQQMDILPTIAQALKLRLEGGRYPGTSLLKPVSPKRPILLSCWYRQFCLGRRDGNLKFIHNFHRGPTQLFDVKKDPDERKNLALSSKTSQNDLENKKRSVIEWRDRINYTYEHLSWKRLRSEVSNKPFAVDVPFKDVRFGKSVRFLGYTNHTKKWIIGRTMELTFVYQCLQKVPKPFGIFAHMHLLGPKIWRGRAWRRQRFHNISHIPISGTYPESMWKPGEFIRDRFRFRIPDRFPPRGTIELSLGLWGKRKGRKRIFLSKKSQHKVRRRALILTQIRLTPPPRRLVRSGTFSKGK